MKKPATEKQEPVKYQPNKRRYPRGHEPEYDKFYNRLLERSRVLNAGLAEKDISNAGLFASEQAIKQKILELAGTEKTEDLFKVNETTSRALRRTARSVTTIQPTKIVGTIKMAEIDLKDNHKRFAAYRRGQIELGYAEKKIKEPTDIKIDRLKFEAILDIRLLECKKLKDKLNEFTKTKEDERSQQVLKYGPKGAVWGDPPLEIDNQKVEFKDGILVIVDELSKYKGMSLADYISSVVKPWNTGQTKPMIYRKNQFMPVAKSDLPEWPTGIKNHLLAKNDEEKES